MKKFSKYFLFVVTFTVFQLSLNNNGSATFVGK